MKKLFYLFLVFIVFACNKDIETINVNNTYNNNSARVEELPSTFKNGDYFSSSHIDYNNGLKINKTTDYKYHNIAISRIKGNYNINMYNSFSLYSTNGYFNGKPNVRNVVVDNLKIQVNLGNNSFYQKNIFTNKYEYIISNDLAFYITIPILSGQTPLQALFSYKTSLNKEYNIPSLGRVKTIHSITNDMMVPIIKSGDTGMSHCGITIYNNSSFNIRKQGRYYSEIMEWIGFNRKPFSNFVNDKFFKDFTPVLSNINNMKDSKGKFFGQYASSQTEGIRIESVNVTSTNVKIEGFYFLILGNENHWYKYSLNYFNPNTGKQNTESEISKNIKINENPLSIRQNHEFSLNFIPIAGRFQFSIPISQITNLK